MTPIEIEANKQQFIETCRKYIKREGLEDLLKYLETRTDFYTAPSSTNFHLNEDGGLCKHSLNVFNIAMQLSEGILSPYIENGESIFQEKIDIESIAVAALFHDLCKTNIYNKCERFKKVDGRWVTYPGWEIKDKFPLGHGEKSCLMISWYLKPFRPEEMLAVRWHMGMYDMGEMGTAQRYAYRSAAEFHPLVTLLHMADMFASNCIEKTTEY